MKTLVKELGKFKAASVLAPLFKFLEATLELLIPLLVSDLIDRGINGGSRSAVIADVAIMITLGAVGLCFSIAGQFFAAKAATGFSAAVREKTFKKLLACPSETTDRIGVSAMITRMTGDIDKMQSGVNLFLRLLLRSPFVVVGAFVAAFLIDPQVSLVFLALIAVLGLIVAIIMKITLPKYEEAQRKLDDVSLLARENLTGARAIRAFGVEEDEIENYKKKTRALEKFRNATDKISSLLNPLTFVAVNLAIVALLRFGGEKVYAGELTQGKIVALYDYLSQILVELVKFAALVITVSKALACAKRVERVLEEDESYKTVPPEKISDSFIEFKNVCARYTDGGDALTDISFTAERGETIGIIGGTGSGKSTLVNLLPRLLDAYEGSVSVDGRDVMSYDPKELRKKIGIVLQKPTIFSGTIESNLRLGNSGATDEDIQKAIAAAQAEDVVGSKDGGLSAKTEQGGKNFSGGQRQRLSIARALARKPEILILDDSSSALDFATDLRLRKAIAKLDPKPTIFIVSQRTSAIAGADKIIVLDDGKVVDTGTDEELSARCEVYKEIRNSQMKAEGEI